MNHIPDTIPGLQGNPFASFWMGGFECADMRNRHGDRVNLLRDSGHLQTVRTDYANLSSLRMHTVREGICWSTCEPSPYHYNWDEVDILISAGIESGTQQLWDICHFGFPDDLT